MKLLAKFFVLIVIGLLITAMVWITVCGLGLSIWWTPVVIVVSIVLSGIGAIIGMLVVRTMEYGWE